MKVSNETADALKKQAKNEADLEWLWHAIEVFPQQPAELAVRNAVLNLRFMKKLEQVPIQVGHFKIRVIGEWISSLIYKENVISIVAFDQKKGTHVASASFFLQITPAGRKFFINNFQGVKRQEISLNQLSTALGENWRVWMAKQLNTIAQKHKMETVGVLPSRNQYLSSPGEYKRQLRQYAQTFRKAGITAIDRSHVFNQSVESRQIDKQQWGWKRKEKIKARQRKRKPRGFFHC